MQRSSTTRVVFIDRAVAEYLIINYTRQHIITVPRRLRKRNVYKEVARLLGIPDGEQIVKEGYVQMRKCNYWNISIVQQYRRFKESRIRSAVFGNSRQFFLMRQNVLGGEIDACLSFPSKSVPKPFPRALFSAKA